MAARAVVALEVAVALVLAARLLPVEAWLRGLEGRLDGLGPIAPVLYAAAYAAGVVAFVPGSLLTMGAGLLFGTALGFAAASAGSHRRRIAGAATAATESH